MYIKVMRGKQTAKHLMRLVLVALLALPSLALAVPAAAQPDQPPDIMVITVQGTVTAGTTQFLRESIEQAEQQQLGALIVLIDTPGGLVDATLDIIQDMLNASVPIVTYVHPRGAIAASAGSFILLAGHVAAMAPGTTTGAAMPVTMQPGAEGQQQADEKTVTFLAGHMKNIAEERGRPTGPAERFITENLTLGATAAEQEGVIEVIAADVSDLLQQLDGRTVSVQQEEVTLRTRGANLVETQMTAGQRIIDFISNPQIAFLLFMLGVYGIFFGLNMPGTIVPETLGAVALILALFGLGMFDVNALGIVLIVIAVILFVAEAFTPTFGFLATGGAVALVAGALLLPVEPLLPQEWYRHFLITVLGMAAVTVGFFALVVTKVVAARGKPSTYENVGMRGYEGEVMDDLDPVGMVRIRGEWWKARSDSNTPIPRQSRIRVTGQEGMVLIVQQQQPERSGDASAQSDSEQ